MAEKPIVTYNEILAGAMLRFGHIENYELNLICVDLQAALDCTLKGYYVFFLEEAKCVKMTDSGNFVFKEGFDLDTVIKEEGITVREKLTSMCSSQVLNYFNSLPVDKYAKDGRFAKTKKFALENLNVLLISDQEADYDALLKYGFQKVNYFKSVNRAERYFDEHYEELDSYHLVIRGHQCTTELLGPSRLDNDVSTKSHLIFATASFKRYNNNGHPTYFTHVVDNLRKFSWNVEDPSSKVIFDTIIKNMMSNHFFARVLPSKPFSPYTDYINPNRLPLPTEKNHLKILLLGTKQYGENPEVVKGIAHSLGLDITYRIDSNEALNDYVRNELGAYDIIIVTLSCSHHLLELNKESTEQCKDTGRELTLLLTRDEDVVSTLGPKPKNGEVWNYRYVFGGKLAPDSATHMVDSKILNSYSQQTDYQSRSIDLEYLNVLMSAVEIYNQALIKMGKPPLTDFNYKTIAERNAEFEEVKRRQEEAQEAERKAAYQKEQAHLEAIADFDEATGIVKNYLKSRYLISTSLKDLRIKENSDGVRVEFLFNGHPISALTFPKVSKKEEIRVFQIQTTSKKGTLLPPEAVGLYTTKYESLNSTPKRPNDNQAKALGALYKRIAYVLPPLIDAAHKKAEDSKKLLFTTNNNNN